jgi:hypothetical protein
MERGGMKLARFKIGTATLHAPQSARPKPFASLCPLCAFALLRLKRAQPSRCRRGAAAVARRGVTATLPRPPIRETKTLCESLRPCGRSTPSRHSDGEARRLWPGAASLRRCPARQSARPKPFASLCPLCAFAAEARPDVPTVTVPTRGGCGVARRHFDAAHPPIRETKPFASLCALCVFAAEARPDVPTVTVPARRGCFGVVRRALRPGDSHDASRARPSERTQSLFEAKRK